MAQYINDVNGEINIGGTLVKFSGVQTGGGEAVFYDETPVAGKPRGTVYPDVRAHITFNISVSIPGNSPDEADAYTSKYAIGTKFDCVSNPSGDNSMRVAGCPEALNRHFVVDTVPQPNYQFQQLTELSFTLKEGGAAGE